MKAVGSRVPLKGLVEGGESVAMPGDEAFRAIMKRLQRDVTAGEATRPSILAQATADDGSVVVVPEAPLAPHLVGVAGSGVEAEGDGSFGSFPCPSTLRFAIDFCRSSINDKLMLASTGNMKDAMRAVFHCRALLDKMLKEVPTFSEFTEGGVAPTRPIAQTRSGDTSYSSGRPLNRSGAQPTKSPTVVANANGFGLPTKVAQEAQSYLNEFRTEAIPFLEAGFTEDITSGKVTAVMMGERGFESGLLHQDSTMANLASPMASTSTFTGDEKKPIHKVPATLVPAPPQQPQQQQQQHTLTDKNLSWRLRTAGLLVGLPTNTTKEEQRVMSFITQQTEKTAQYTQTDTSLRDMVSVELHREALQTIDVLKGTIHEQTRLMRSIQDQLELSQAALYSRSSVISHLRSTLLRECTHLRRELIRLGGGDVTDRIGFFGGGTVLHPDASGTLKRTDTQASGGSTSRFSKSASPSHMSAPANTTLGQVMLDGSQSPVDDENLMRKDSGSSPRGSASVVMATNSHQGKPPQHPSVTSPSVINGGVVLMPSSPKGSVEIPHSITGGGRQHIVSISSSCGDPQPLTPEQRPDTLAATFSLLDTVLLAIESGKVLNEDFCVVSPLEDYRNNTGDALSTALPSTYDGRSLNAVTSERTRLPLSLVPSTPLQGATREDAPADGRMVDNAHMQAIKLYDHLNERNKEWKASFLRMQASFQLALRRKDREIKMIKARTDLDKLRSDVFAEITLAKEDMMNIRSGISDALEVLRDEFGRFMSQTEILLSTLGKEVKESRAAVTYHKAALDLPRAMCEIIQPMIYSEFAVGVHPTWNCAEQQNSDPLWTHMLHAHGADAAHDLRTDIQRAQQLLLYLQRYVSQSHAMPHVNRPVTGAPLNKLASLLIISQSCSNDLAVKIREVVEMDYYHSQQMARFSFRLKAVTFYQQVLTLRARNALLKGGINPDAAPLPVRHKVARIGEKATSLRNLRQAVTKARLDNARKLWRLWQESGIDIWHGQAVRPLRDPLLAHQSLQRHIAQNGSLILGLLAPGLVFSVANSKAVKV